MTYRAGLILRSLAVKVRCSRGPAERGSRVALKAKDVEVAGFDQAGIWGTVCRMAVNATLRLDRLMFEDERSVLIRMASVAN